MAEIKGNQIIQDEHLANAIKNAERYLEITKQTTKALQDEAKALKAVTSANPLTNAKDFEALNASLYASKKALKDFNAQQKAAIDLELQISGATDANVKAQIRLANAKKEQKKLLSDVVALENKELGTLQKLAIASNKLRAERDKLNLETKEGAQRLKEINAQLDLNNAKLRASSDAMKNSKLNVGNYTDSINKAKIGVMNLASAFGIVSGIMLFTNAIKGAFNTIKENEDAFASLSAITGLTGEKFEVFRTAINKTATELKVSSTDVAEAAEKIASAQPKLLENADALAEVTKQAIILNKAIKGDLTETSMALVGVMNQFGLGGDEAARIINVLAAGSKAGAATVNQLNASMVKFGTTADLMNISVEESVGLIETLGEKAIFGEEAGTALRNILLKMGSIDVLPKKALAQLAKFGVDTDIVKDKSLSFEERLRELSKVAGDTTAIMQIFGTENATAATVLLNNIDTYGKMTAAVTGTNVANEQMAINTNTVSAKLEELGAAWDNMVTEWANGNDVGGTVKDVLSFITENLKEIVGWVFEGIKVWASYKIAMKLWNSEGTGVIQTLVSMVTPLKKTGDAVKDLEAKTQKAKLGFAGWVAIIVALLPYLKQAAQEVWDLATGQGAAEKATARFNDEIGKEKDKMQLLYDQLKLTNAGSSERKTIIDKINSTYGTTLQNLGDETAFLKQLETAYRDVIAQMEKKLMAQILEEDYLEALRKKREADKAVSELTNVDLLLNSNRAIGLLIAQEEANKAIADLRKEMARLNITTGDVGSGFGNLHKGQAEVQDDLETTTSGVSNLNTELKKTTSILEDIKGASYTPAAFDPLHGKINVTEDDDTFSHANVSEIIPDGLTVEETKEIDDDLTQNRIDNIERIIEATKNLAKALEDSNNLKIQKIDQEIANSKDEIQMRNDRISQMKELAAQGVLTAQESIKAEEMKVDSLQNKIAALEAKKQKLLVINLALQTASNLADSGDPAAIEKATGQIGAMFEKIKSYKSGVDKTGRGNVDKDGGFHAVLHPNEMVVQAPLTKGLYERGLDRDDTAMYAMRYHDEVMNGNAMSHGSFGDVMTLAALNGIKESQDKVAELISELPKKMPITKTNYNAIERAIVDSILTNNEIKNYFTYLRK